MNSSGTKSHNELFSDINTIFERNTIENEIKQILFSFESKSKDPIFKKGIYIYGSPGCGKTEFVINLLKNINYDVIKYDAGDVRNKSLIETITNNNISNRNVLNMMNKTVKKIAIVMDEIDGMNNGDKGGITALIKLIRRKKTKKQKLENMTMNPIICIGNYYIDKKIKELMKVCNVFELKTPTTEQMSSFLNHIIPQHISIAYSKPDYDTYKKTLLSYIQGDIRKLKFIYDMMLKKPEMITQDIIENIFHRKTYSEDTKKNTQMLINTPVKFEDHIHHINETDRTIIALLWHENIVDLLANKPNNKTFPFYSKILENICFADYIDRVTFQYQIWQFNELSSLIKTFHNNKLYHDNFPENKNLFKPAEVRFTKILTKYSTEYNNMIFIYNLSQELDLDKKDMTTMFQELRIYADQYSSEKNTVYEDTFETCEITKLDIRRIYRYLDKNIKKEVVDDELIDDVDD